MIDPAWRSTAAATRRLAARAASLTIQVIYRSSGAGWSSGVDLIEQVKYRLRAVDCSATEAGGAGSRARQEQEFRRNN